MLSTRTRETSQHSSVFDDAADYDSSDPDSDLTDAHSESGLLEEEDEEEEEEEEEDEEEEEEEEEESEVEVVSVKHKRVNASK
ncbi:hypothetical protein H0H93_011353, partial [Arthromyces matolae]